MARTLKKKVSYTQLLVSKSLYQVTWGTRGKAMRLLSKARNLEESCSPVSVDDKGKRLCYSGVYLLVNGQTEAGIQSLEEAVSLMTGTPEKIILKNIAIQILATYHRFKNNSSGMSEFFSKSIHECQSLGTKHLLFIPPMGGTAKKTKEKERTQQPLKLEIICLVLDAAKHLMDTETKRCIIDAAQEITNGIRNSPVPSSLGSFIFQCNANITLQCVTREDEGADKMPKQRISSYHETAVNLHNRPTTAPAQLTRTANELPRPITRQSSRIRRPVTAVTEQPSRLADSYHSLENGQHQNDDLISATPSKKQALKSNIEEIRALDIRLKIFGEEHSSTADSYHSLGDTQHAQGDFSSALQSKQRALDIRFKLFGEDHASTADSYHSLGETQYALHDFSSALQSTQRAVDIRFKLFGEEHSSTADSYHSLGDMQHALHDFSSALQSKQRALDIRLELFGEDHASTADSYHSIGDTQHAQGDFASALQSKQHALDTRFKLFGEDHSSTAGSYHSLGDTQHALDDFSSALQSKQRALDIWFKLFGEDHSSTADSYHSLGDSQHAQGDFSSALQSKQHALDIRLKMLGEEHSSTGNSYHSLGDTQHELGYFSSALQSKQRALNIRLRLFGEEHSSTADSYH